MEALKITNHTSPIKNQKSKVTKTCLGSYVWCLCGMLNIMKKDL